MQLFVCTFSTEQIPKGMLVFEAKHILQADALVEALLGEQATQILIQHADEESLREAVPETTSA